MWHVLFPFNDSITWMKGFHSHKHLLNQTQRVDHVLLALHCFSSIHVLPRLPYSNFHIIHHCYEELKHDSVLICQSSYSTPSANGAFPCELNVKTWSLYGLLWTRNDYHHIDCNCYDTHATLHATRRIQLNTPSFHASDCSSSSTWQSTSTSSTLLIVIITLLTIVKVKKITKLLSH